MRLNIFTLLGVKLSKFLICNIKFGENILNTKSKLSVMALTLALALGLTACKDEKATNQSADVAKQAQEQNLTVNDKSSFEVKASYAIGASVGSYLRHLQSTQEQYIGKLDEAFIKQGFADALAEKSSLDNKAIETVLRDLDKKVQEAMEAQAKKEAQANLEAGKKFLEENAKKEGVKVTSSGLQYKVIKEGNGLTPKSGDTINVIYKGTTIDGKVFDEQKEGVEFPLDNMIPGWVEGLQLMKAGSQFEFYIPADLAYGEAGAADVIKPNSVLVFDVTLVDVKKAESKDTENKAEDEVAPEKTDK